MSRKALELEENKPLFMRNPGMGTNRWDETKEPNFKKTVIINDTKHRYYLTKKETLDQLRQMTGAAFEPIGKYFPVRSLAVEENDLLLSLVISGDSREQVKQGQELVENIVENGPIDPVLPGVDVLFIEGKEMYRARIETNMEDMEGFNVASRLAGPNNQYFDHIQNTTQTLVRGSNTLEIVGDNLDSVSSAKSLCEDLIKTIKQEYLEHRAKAAGLAYTAPAQDYSAYYNDPNYAAYAAYYQQQYAEYYKQYQENNKKQQ